MAILSLFGNDNLDSEQRRKVHLAQLGGGLAGAGAGFLTSKVMDARHEGSLFEAGMDATRDNEKAELQWKRLMDLYLGKITIRDIPIPERDFYSRKLEENKETLEFFRKNPEEFEQSFNDIKGGRLQPLFGQKPSFKDLLFRKRPSHVDLRGENVVPLFSGEKEALMEIPHSIHNPKAYGLAGTLATMGAVGAGYLTEKKYQKENKGKYDEQDLDKLQQMLQALNMRG